MTGWFPAAVVFLVLACNHVQGYLGASVHAISAHRGKEERSWRLILRSSVDKNQEERDQYPRVLCHGEILYDRIALPGAAGWDLDRVVKEKAERQFPGGAPANVACALSKLGVPSSFVGAVGNDNAGHELLDVLKGCGVDIELTTVIDGYPTRTVMVTRDKEGDRNFAGFGERKSADCFADCQDSISSLREKVMPYLGPGSWLVQGTLGLAYPGSWESHKKLAEWAKAKGATRYVDINWRPVFWELAGAEKEDCESLARKRIAAFTETADVVKLTDEEAEWLCGVSSEEALRNPSCLRDFFPSTQIILVSAGEKGAAYDFGGRTGRVPCFRECEIIETTGAGDAFSAGFITKSIDLFTSPDGGLVEKAEGYNSRETLLFASAVGALTCGGDGGIAPQPSMKEVEDLVMREAAAI